MRKLLALVVLLSVTCVGRAGEKGVVEGLEKKNGALVQYYRHQAGQVLMLHLRVGYDDADLPDLCELPRLKWLLLEGRGFTDAGLRRVEGLNRLQALTLLDCPNVSPGAVERLRKALPGCRVEVHP
jgi:hypothetical protein